MTITELEYEWYSQDIKRHPINIKAEHREVFCLIYKIAEKENVKYCFFDPENKDRVYLCLSKKQCLELHDLMTAKLKNSKDSTHDSISYLLDKLFKIICLTDNTIKNAVEAL